MPDGVIGNTSDFGSEESRFDPWSGNEEEKADLWVGLFLFQPNTTLPTYHHLRGNFKTDTRETEATVWLA
jgi:hypothetical protein